MPRTTTLANCSLREIVRVSIGGNALRLQLSNEFSQQPVEIKAVYIESPANPLLSVTDIEAVSKLAKEYGKLTIVDNTFLTPYLQRPLTLGADIVVHSGTKYLGGHSDTVSGFVIVKDKELADKLYYLQNAIGGVLAPWDSFLMIRGIKTLGVRMDRHVANAERIAEWLSESGYVEKVYYPGLKSDPGYEVQKKQADGPGAMISLRLRRSMTTSSSSRSSSLLHSRKVSGVLSHSYATRHQ
jgi:cystathionine beta-lyase/cystathionine gamma-synthase